MRFQLISFVLATFFLTSVSPIRELIFSVNEPADFDDSASSCDTVRTAVDFKVSGLLQKLKQPSDNTCWATAATIMRSWKDNTALKILDVARKAGATYEAKFKNDDGLTGLEKPAFLKALGLKSKAPQSYTVDGWLNLLKGHGPLWLTTSEDPSNPFSLHARILTGIAGDGTPDATFLTFLDPATGTESSESVTVFTNKFEAMAKKEKATTVFPQVVHY